MHSFFRSFKKKRKKVIQCPKIPKEHILNNNKKKYIRVLMEEEALAEINQNISQSQREMKRINLIYRKMKRR